MALAIALHALAAVIWVGGMFFAHVVARPSAGEVLESPQRLALWQANLRRFFQWVWAAVIVLPITGYWMVFSHYGGMAGIGWYINVMQLLGIIMILLYLHVFFAPYRRLKRSLAANDLEAGARCLSQIRLLVGINLVLGLIVVIVAAGGPYI